MNEFFTEPRIELVGRPVMDIQGVLQFLSDHDMDWPELHTKLESNMDLGDRDAEWLIQQAGRGCYMSFGKSGRSHDEHIKHLIEVGHGSVLEHVNFNFHIWGVSRSLTHELVRHRAGAAYSQLSQRYVDESDTAFVVPPAMLQLKERDPNAYKEWELFCLHARDFYAKLTSRLSDMYEEVENKTERRKKARQAARSVLPNATETKIFVTFNGRAVRHFLEMRGSPAADLEIRKLAVAMFKIMEQEFSLITHGMSLITLDDGTEGVESAYRKV